MTSTIGKLRRGPALAATLICLAVFVLFPARAAVYAYPLEKQSPQQQQQDEIECTRWASERTGFDPMRPPAYQGGGTASAPPSGSRGGVFGSGSYGGVSDAGRGAALGALGGAIAGNAGAGAAIGAMSGVFIGGVKRSNAAAEREAWERSQAQQQAQQRQQHEREIAQLRGEHDRAFATCMSARGYRVN